MVEHYPSAMVRMKRTSTRNTEEGEAVSADVSKLQLSLLCEANERIRVLETDLKTSEIARERAVTEAESLRDELSNARALLHAVGLCPQNGLSKFSNRSIQEVKRRHDELAEKNRKCSIEVISLRQQVDGLQRECDMRREALREAREFNPAYAQVASEALVMHNPILTYIMPYPGVSWVKWARNTDSQSNRCFSFHARPCARFDRVRNDNFSSFACFRLFSEPSTRGSKQP